MATNSYQSQTLFCQTLFFKGGFREIVLVLLLLEQSDTDNKSIVSEVMAIFRKDILIYRFKLRGLNTLT